MLVVAVLDASEVLGGGQAHRVDDVPRRARIEKLFAPTNSGSHSGLSTDPQDLVGQCLRLLGELRTLDADPRRSPCGVVTTEIPPERDRAEDMRNAAGISASAAPSRPISPRSMLLCCTDISPRIPLCPPCVKHRSTCSAADLGCVVREMLPCTDTGGDTSTHACG